MEIRTETPEDQAAIRTVNQSAFESGTEAGIVDALRAHAHPIISLVADMNGLIVGHIMFSPVILEGHADVQLMGLGPMAVLPDYQRQGIGSALVRAGLDKCKVLGTGAVVVLGHPQYYPRFGFSPAQNFGISCDYDVPPEVFMVLELQPGYLNRLSGRIIYDDVFNV